MNLTDFHAWLCRESPARADEITARLDTLHRVLPKAYADWPKGAAQVSEALRALEIKGLVKRDGNDWAWVSAAKALKDRPQMELFA